MLEHYLRPIYQWLFVKPILKFITLFPFVTPNKLTVLGLFFGLLAGASILFSPILASVLLLISGYFDTLDGSLARLKNISSPKGTVLDITCDRVVEISVMLGLFAVDPAHRAWSCLLMFSAVFLCITSFLVVGIFVKNGKGQDIEPTRNKSFHYSRGLIERAEAFVFFLLMILLPENYFIYLSNIFSCLVFYTAIKRLRDFFVFT